MIDLDHMDHIRSECLQSLCEAGENVLKHLEGGESSRHVKALRGLSKKYCTLDYQAEVCQQALEDVMVGASTNTLHTLDDNFVKILKDLVSKKPNVKNHPIMTQFDSRVQLPSSQFNESDIVETESSQVYLDPFTKKRIVTPVKNTHCGHVYEKTSIMAMLKQKGALRCPVMGCGNRQNIQKSDLVVDDNLKAMLSQMADDGSDESS